jgi:hypothetical protein
VIRVLLVVGAALVLVPSAAALDWLNVPSDLKVVSYYPTNAGWTEMWTNWEPSVIATDFDRATALDANTVRAIIQPDTFGWPHPSPLFAKRLAEFVSLAAAHGLHVQLTLFDWWYRWPHVRESKTWVRELLTPYIGDPRIACVELRNEILPKRETDTWARRMIPFIRQLMGGETPVTLSVAGRDPVRRLEKLKRGLGDVRPDFFDIHYFGGEGGATAYEVFAQAKEIAAPTPLWIGETGYTTVSDASGYGGIPDTVPSQEAAQSLFLESVNWAARANGLPADGIWVLDDLVPAAVPDRVAHADDPELHYGLYRVDGTAKPAAGIVKAAFEDATPLDFNAGFEDAVPSGSGIVVPTDWEMSGRDVVFTRDATVAASGVASGRLAPYGGGGTGSFSLVPPDGGVSAGTRVMVTASAQRADPNGQVFLVIEWHDEANRLLRRDASAPLGADATTWATLSVSGIAPRDAAYARIDLVGENITAPVWFDDVSFARY